MTSVIRWASLLVLASIAFCCSGDMASCSLRNGIYVLTPALVFVGVFSYAASGASWLRERFPSLLTLGLATFLVSISYGTFAPGIIGPSWPNLKAAFRSGELFISTYFLFALILIILMARALLLRVCRFVFTRTDSSDRRQMAVDLISFALLLTIAIPYTISAIFVHRFKVANAQTPADWARPFETVEFPTSDGLMLHGWFVPAKEPSAKTIILCHGIGGNSAAFLGYFRALDKLETNVFFFDFRGHGASGGHTVSMGGREKLDVLAAAQFVRERWPEQSRQLFAIGISMGSSALNLAAAELEPPFDAIIIDSGFAAATDLTNNVLRQFPGFVRPAMACIGLPMASLEAGYDLADVRPEDCIGNSRCRVLIVHATGDFLIPVAHAHRLFDGAKEPKKLWILDANQHGGVLLDCAEGVFRFRARD